MKAIVCGVGGIEVFSPATEGWRKCPCGCTAARWEDPEAGKIVVASSHHELVRGLGLVNTVLVNMFNRRGQAWQDFREDHEAATSLDGYVFHRDKAACWAVPFIIGTTSDSRWATREEYAEALL